jgi:uncharacterized lipoprotein
MKKTICLLLTSFYLSACGLSPQVVTINPDLNNTDAVPAEIYSTFNLTITDARKSDTLGKRGGVYKETSIVKTEGDITKKIHEKLVDAFQGAGYKIDPSATNQLNVSIVKLSYQGHGENRVGEVEVGAEILATATNSETKFTKSYKASRKKEVLKAPDEQKNESMINDIFSAVIQRVLEDEELLSYIN